MANNFKSVRILINTYINNHNLFIKSTKDSKIIYLNYKKYYNFILITCNCILILYIILY